jgi:hypothetical protein
VNPGSLAAGIYHEYESRLGSLVCPKVPFACGNGIALMEAFVAGEVSGMNPASDFAPEEMRV